MESVPAGTLVIASPSLKTASGGAVTLAAEGAASASLPFAALLQSGAVDELVQMSEVATGSTTQQDGQPLSATGGNSWPLLLPVVIAQHAEPVVAAAAAGIHQNSKESGDESADSAAAELLPAAPGSLASIKSLPEGSGLPQAGLAAFDGAQGRPKDPLLTAARGDETSPQPSGTGLGVVDSASQNLLPSATAQVTSLETPILSPSARLVISPRLDAPHWDDAFASRVVWMAKEKYQFVELRLNPPDLGSVNVKMALHQNDASIAIGVHNAAVREAIEATLPRLRELLAESGVSLINVDVSSSHGFANGGRGWAADRDGYESPYGSLAEVDSDPLSPMDSNGGALRGVSTGIVDRYA